MGVPLAPTLALAGELVKPEPHSIHPAQPCQPRQRAMPLEAHRSDLLKDVGLISIHRSQDEMRG